MGGGVVAVRIRGQTRPPLPVPSRGMNSRGCAEARKARSRRAGHAPVRQEHLPDARRRTSRASRQMRRRSETDRADYTSAAPVWRYGSSPRNRSRGRGVTATLTRRPRRQRLRAKRVDELSARPRARAIRATPCGRRALDLTRRRRPMAARTPNSGGESSLTRAASVASISLRVRRGRRCRITEQLFLDRRITDSTSASNGGPFAHRRGIREAPWKCRRHTRPRRIFAACAERGVSCRRGEIRDGASRVGPLTARRASRNAVDLGASAIDLS